MKKATVVIYLHQIRHYRIPIYRVLSKNFKITLITKDQTQVDLYKDEPFIVVYIPIIIVGPFLFHKINLHKFSSKFDVAIGLMNLRCLDILSLSLNLSLKTKLILWGIGVSASYEKNFDENTKLDFLRFWLFKKADALLFYTNYPVKKYVENGFRKDSLFIANNTVEVIETSNKDNSLIRDKLLFIGSLYPQKGINELLESYLSAFKSIGDILNKLYIIGEGEEYDRIKNFIKVNNLNNQILLEGAIYDQKTLKDYFLSSILCISPKQAGLSVLMSMGYSSCFVTKFDAITGGEILNIKNNETGIIYNRDKELSEIIIRANDNPDKFIEIGKNAKHYYLKNRKPEHMAKGIEDAINFALK